MAHSWMVLFIACNMSKHSFTKKLPIQISSCLLPYLSIYEYALTSRCTSFDTEKSCNKKYKHYPT